MATTFITGIALRPGRTPYQTARDSLTYIMNPKKTRSGELVSAFRCTAKSAPLEMIHEQTLFEQKTDRKVIQKYDGKRKSYLLMTVRQSFAPGEVTPEQAHRLGCELAKRFLGDKYQYVVATHIDKAHIHNHIIFNIIGSDGKKYRQTKYTPEHLRALSDRLCRENSLSVVEPSEYQKRRYTNERVTSFRTILKNDIEQCIRAARNYEDFLNRMRERYYVTDTGSVLKFRHRTNGQQRPIRSYTLGKGYARPELFARAESGEQIFNSVTISQKLRNIEAMIHAVGFLRENGADFEEREARLRDTMEETRQLLEKMRNKITDAQGVDVCFDVLEQNGPVYSRYVSGSMTEPEAEEHGDEIRQCRDALAALRENHLGADREAREKFRAELSESQKQAAELEKQFREIRGEIARAEEVREISERVESDDPILVSRKGDKQYGR